MEKIARRLEALQHSPQMAAREALARDWLASGLHSPDNLAVQVARAVAAHPETRIVFGSREHPWEGSIAQIQAESVDVAAGLYRLGLRAGEVIVLQIPNRREAVVAMLAAFRLGLIVVPVVHLYGTAELEYILRETEASALVLPDAWKKVDYHGRVAALEPDLPLRHVIVIGEGEMPVPVVRWNTLYGSNEALPPVEVIPAERPCMVNFTSGSTAAPKGVVHSHQTFGAEILTFPGVWKNRRRLSLVPMPGGHMAGLIAYLRVFLCHEGTIFIDQWEPAMVQELLELHRPEFFGGVPMQVEAMLATAPRWKPDPVVQVMVGGASVPPSLVEFADSIGCPATRAYGLTEHPTVTGSSPTAPLAKRSGTDGCPTPGNAIRLVDDNGAEVPVGEQGEILTMGPELCLGYLDAALNEEAFTADGWFRTGDIGVLDADGYMCIVDRKKDIIIRGGENISAKELEDVLVTHPAVIEVGAVGFPDPRYGERPGVFVRLRSEANLTLVEVREHFRSAGLLVHKTPEYLEVVQDFPRTPVGKILKPELRKIAARLVRDRETSQ